MDTTDSSQTSAPTPDRRWIHPLCQALALDRNGPLLVLPDDRLLGADEEGLITSADDGRTWAPTLPARYGQHPREPGSFYLIRTDSGVLVMVYLDLSSYHFQWNEPAGEPEADCRLDLCAVRSLDGGRTWVDRQVLLDGYNANFFGFIKTRGGRLVVPAEHLTTRPGRWIVCSLSSSDDGRTWRRSNWIDLGGHGHHDGATEPTVAELSDGRLMMLIRTNLDRFWQAFSDDGGQSWRTIQPSTIDASSSPGFLMTLRSGRLLLVWNRLNPEHQTAWPRKEPGPFSEVSASWYREELSAALSEDDGGHWTRPIVIARQPGGQLSYPFLLERRPGECWITAGFAHQKGWRDPLPLRLKIREEELLDAASRG